MNSYRASIVGRVHEDDRNFVLQREFKARDDTDAIRNTFLDSRAFERVSDARIECVLPVTRMVRDWDREEHRQIYERVTFDIPVSD